VLIGRHFLEYTERVRVKFRRPSVRVFLKNIALQIGYGEAECGTLDSNGKSLRAKAGTVRGGIRSDINMLVPYLWRNGPRCIFRQLTLRCEANAQDIVAKGDNLKEYSGVAEFDSIRESFTRIWFLRFIGNLFGLGLLLA
jgi:hypothetical protein